MFDITNKIDFDKNIYYMMRISNLFCFLLFQQIRTTLCQHAFQYKLCTVNKLDREWYQDKCRKVIWKQFLTLKVHENCLGWIDIRRVKTNLGYVHFYMQKCCNHLEQRAKHEQHEVLGKLPVLVGRRLQHCVPLAPIAAELQHGGCTARLV